MSTIIWILIIVAIVYYYKKKNKEQGAKNKEQERQSEETAKNQVKNKEQRAKNTDEERAQTVETAKSKESRAKNTDDAQDMPATQSFPYPAKNPGKCRFPSASEIANFQEYGEEPVAMHESEFKEWWFFCEDPDKPVWSYVGTDKEQKRCILQRRYRHGDDNHPTFEKRFFVIKRNIMASIFALALIEDKMDRNDYKEQMAQLDRLFPKTNNAETDGPPVLLPPQELLEKPSQEEIAKMKREEEKQRVHNQVVWQDGVRKLWFDGDTLKLRYNGTDYFFSGHGYEPMAIILNKNGEVAYIHNSFIVEEECREFVKNPKYLCRTITGHYHNAKHFCMLLTTAIDYGYEWQINDLESKMWSIERFEQREVFYNADNIEFGIYGYEIDDEIDPSELDDDEPKTHFEYDIMYIIVDGKEYHLHDADLKRLGQLGIFEKGCHKPKIRINGTNGSVIAAYTDEWRSGKDFTPFGFPCNTKMFCQMMAYAIRTGKLEYQMQKLANIVAGEPPESKASDTIYEDKDARLYLEGMKACLKYKGRAYHFGYDGREPFATISGSNIYVIIRQGENVDATCRYFQKNPEGTIETITGRKLDVAHFCKLLCAAVAHDHGQDSDMEYYMDALERKAFELEDYRERRRKMEEKSAKTMHITYTRESVCVADDYINRKLEINMSPNATLADLIKYISGYDDDTGYAAIPYTGGNSCWYIMNGDHKLAEVLDSGKIISFCDNNPETQLHLLGLTKLYGKR